MKHLLLTTIAAVVLVGCGDALKEASEISINEAAYNGDVEIVKYHLTAGVDVNTEAQDRWTPLHEAAFWGHKEVVELLIKNGANVNAKTRHQQTVLHCVVQGEAKDETSVKIRSKIIQLLVDSGANVNAKDGGNKVPIDYAKQHFSDLLKKYGGKYTSIHAAILDGDKESLQSLLDAGANVNDRDKNLRTTLDLAIGEANIDIVELLIQRGADVNAMTMTRSPLSYATDKEQKEIAVLLINAGADVNGRVHSWDETHLYRWAQIGQLDIVELLINKGADVNAKHYGTTPLDRAITYEHSKVANLLRKHGAISSPQSNTKSNRQNPFLPKDVRPYLDPLSPDQRRKVFNQLSINQILKQSQEVRIFVDGVITDVGTTLIAEKKYITLKVTESHYFDIYPNYDFDILQYQKGQKIQFSGIWKLGDGLIIKHKLNNASISSF